MKKGDRFIYRFFAGATVFLLSSLSAYAATLNMDEYDVYYGDFNNDGLPNDVYFHGIEKLILIHGDIATPIEIPGPQGYVYYEDGDGFLVPLNIDKGQLSNYQLANEGTDYVLADINQDGVYDTFTYNDGSNEEQIYLAAGENPPSSEIASLDPTGDVGPGPQAPETGQPVGSLDGQFRVNEAGAASYNIPLNLPKGTADVTPQLAFSYNSQGGSGLMGQGWSLSGLSAISRCRQTLAQDGQARAISWSAEDRFCLDGQRLILVEGSQYGAPGSVYRTEIDAYVQVTAQGGSTGHPDYFEVTAKDGSLTRYGYRSDARLSSPEGTLTWAQSQFEDSVGNRIDYRYTGGADTGLRISRVEYAYPSIDSSTDPRASVAFEYEARPDIQARYVRGYSFQDTMRLAKVTVENQVDGVAESLYRQYRLSYQSDDLVPSDALSRLASLQECATEGDGACLEKTQFTWPLLNSVSIANPESGSVDAAQPYAAHVGKVLNAGDSQRVLRQQHMDINGDGKLDLVWLQAHSSNIDAQSLYFALSDSQGDYTAPVRVTSFDAELSHYSKNIRMNVLDYNADGRQDLIVHQKDASGDRRWRLFLAKPSATYGWALSESSANFAFTEQDRVNFGDITSDGLADAFYLKDETLHIHPLEVDPDASISSSQYYQFAPSADNHALPTDTLPELTSDKYWRLKEVNLSGLGDFNGDGRTDLIVVVEEVTKNYSVSLGGYTERVSDTRHMVYVSSDNGFEAWGLLSSSAEAFRALDINNDGLADLVYQSGTNWRFMLSTGKGWTDSNLIGGLDSDPEEKDLLFADVNRDGYPDLLRVTPSSGIQRHNWQPELGQFATESTNFTHRWTIEEEDQILVFDIDGDGWQDVIQFDSINSYWRPTLSSHKDTLSPNQITAIEDGLGNKTEIEYELLTHTGHYTRVDVGEPVTEEMDEVCTWVPVRTSTVTYSEERCHTPVHTSIDTTRFYESLNKPFEQVLQDNEGLPEPTTPVLELYAPMPIVTQVASSAPHAANSDAQARVSYYYDQMKFQAGGRGSLGFRKLTTVDEQSGIVTESRYRQDWPFIGSPLETVTRVGTGTGEPGPELSRAENQWGLKTVATATGGHYYQSYVKTSIEKDYELKSDGVQQGAELTTVTTTTEQDGWGNVTSLVVTTTGGTERHVKTTHNEYGSGDQQRLGRLSRTEVTTEYGGQTDTRVAEFHYHTSGALAGLLKTEIAAAQATELAQTTEHYYDNYGNRTYSETTGADGTRRQSERAHYVERHTPIVVFAKLALVGFGKIPAVFPHWHRR